MAASPPAPTLSPAPFTLLPDDLLLQILSRLFSADPRHLPRLSCVSPRFRSLLLHLSPHSLPLPLPLSLSLSLSPSLPFPTLHKLSVCCPGLLHSGVLFHQHSTDFGLSLDIGPDLSLSLPSPPVKPPVVSTTPTPPNSNSNFNSNSDSSLSWSLFDDLYTDSSYDLSETLALPADNSVPCTFNTDINNNNKNNCSDLSESVDTTSKRKRDTSNSSNSSSSCSSSSSDDSKKNRSWVGPTGAHLASGSWSLSREQGSKLLASRFRGDCLYICDWPGCVHEEPKRKYMLFRGVFKDFKKSRVWKTIVDSKKGRVRLGCAYCQCMEMWDLHSAFCLRGFIGFHEDGEPVVRAYVCENGHVSGAWTERPMYG